MHVKHLSLGNFRNYETAELALEPGVTILVGRNGQGKTNLVEAIGYCSTLSSHRVSGYVPLIKTNTSKAVIRVLAEFAGRQNLVELELSIEGSNRAKVNRGDLSRIRDVLGYIQTVIFAPEDLNLVKGDPSDRRNFLDTLLVQLSPRLAGTLSDYDRVLKQRNTLLKTSRSLPANSPGLSTLEAWDHSLVELGSEIIIQRDTLVEALHPFLEEAYKSISEEKNNPSMFIKTSVLSSAIDLEMDTSDQKEKLDKGKISEQFLARLRELRTKELERGITLVGPHRDDLVLKLGDLPAKGYISHGETWSYALSLKLACVGLLKSKAQAGDPILILDDVFAELDTVRRSRLVDLISANEQVIITAAVAEDIPEIPNARIFSVTNGRVELSNG
jgi:DNA replication and repair protein RecF